MELTYDAEIPLLGIYLKDLIVGTQTDICTLMFIAVLFTITKTQNQPNCPLMDEWINTQCLYIQWNIIQPQKGRKV